MRAGFEARLRCPACGGDVGRRTDPASGGGEALQCARCARRYAVRDGIPRFVTVAADCMARRTQESFGYEWTAFGDWRASGPESFQDYFAGVDLSTLGRLDVLDAGCGMGRHARLLAPHAASLVALDFSAAIDQAARNLAACPNVDCVQGDLHALPFAEGAFDFVYSFGVLHHLADTEGALRHVVSRVRPGGRVRVYLYWKRRGVAGALLKAVGAVRLVTTRLPLPVLKRACWALGAALFAGVVLPYRVLLGNGVRLPPTLPLVTYVKYPFSVIWNDQFDRLSAPIEKRFTEAEVVQLLAGAGLAQISIWPRHGWLAEGVRPC